jgi:hypothetical protein
MACTPLQRASRAVPSSFPSPHHSPYRSEGSFCYHPATTLLPEQGKRGRSRPIRRRRVLKISAGMGRLEWAEVDPGGNS